ncbi:MAG: nucleotidyltransferase domain-containing protein [Promethearchaeota archaeon]
MIEKIKKLKDRHILHLNNELRRIKEELIKLDVEKIILFGSGVRNQLGLLSDIDLIVILASNKPYLERMQDIYKRLQPSEVDLFVYTPEEFRDMKENNLFIQHVLKEGRILFEKS